MWDNHRGPLLKGDSELRAHASFVEKKKSLAVHLLFHAGPQTLSRPRLACRPFFYGCTQLMFSTFLFLFFM